MRFNCEVATMPALSFVHCSNQSLPSRPSLSVWSNRYHLGSITLSRVVSSCPLSSFVSLLHSDHHGRPCELCNDSLVSFRPPSLLLFAPSLFLLSSFSPLSLLYPPLSLLYLIINISLTLMQMKLSSWSVPNRTQWGVIRHQCLCWMLSIPHISHTITPIFRLPLNHKKICLCFLCHCLLSLCLCLPVCLLSMYLSLSSLSMWNCGWASVTVSVSVTIPPSRSLTLPHPSSPLLSLTHAGA